MNVRKMIILFLIVFCVPKIFAYSVVDRYTILEDRFKTQDMLRPFGHDFIFDIGLSLNKNLTDVIDEVDDATKTPSSANDYQPKIEAAQALLEKYRDTEQTARLNLNLGIPLFSFKVWKVKIVPDFRIGVNWGLNLGFRSEPLTVETIAGILGNEIPAELRDAISENYDNYGPGADLITSDICTAASIPLGAECDQYKNKYFFPQSPDIPNIFLFTKLDGKAGFLINYFKENWFGYLNIYGLHRTDYVIRITAEGLAHGQDILDRGTELNSHLLVDLDYKLGYKYERYSFFGLIEEIKLTKISDNVKKAGGLIYGTSPLIRLHADARFEWFIFSALPFVGVHKRSGYGLDKGIYFGADFGAYVWGDRLGVQFRGMVDKEHITLSPRVKLWLMQLEYALKTPTSSTTDDVKVSALHTLNFRLFF